MQRDWPKFCAIDRRLRRCAERWHVMPPVSFTARFSLAAAAHRMGEIYTGFWPDDGLPKHQRHISGL